MKSRCIPFPSVGLRVTGCGELRHACAAIGFIAMSWLAGCGSSDDATADPSTGRRDSGSGATSDASPGTDAIADDASDASASDGAFEVAGRDVVMDSTGRDSRLPVDGADAFTGPADDAAIDAPSDDSADGFAAEVGEESIDTLSDDGADGSGAEAAAASIDTMSAFTCASLGGVAANVLERRCFDFSSASQATSFGPEAGTWTVAAGSYIGVGPPDGQVTCPGGPFGGTAMTTSVLSTLSAADVRVHARMTSVTAADKVVVLRAQPSGDRIELDFRSYFTMDDVQHGGDVVVSMLSACSQVFFVLPDAIPFPQYDGTPIDVDVQLVGGRLTMSVDGKQIYDGAPTATGIDGGTRELPSAPGSVGFGVFRDGEASFDDLVVEVLR